MPRNTAHHPPNNRASVKPLHEAPKKYISFASALLGMPHKSALEHFIYNPLIKQRFRRIARLGCLWKDEAVNNTEGSMRSLIMFLFGVPVSIILLYNIFF